jgi:putative hemolysin
MRGRVLLNRFLSFWAVCALLCCGLSTPSQAEAATAEPLITITTYGGFDVRTAIFRQAQLSRVKQLITTVGLAAKPPAKGWGFPGVADVPNTRIVITMPHLHRKISIYALAFSNGGNLNAEQVRARKALNTAVEALNLYVRSLKGKPYAPKQYEAWNGMALVMGGLQGDKGTDVGSSLANPASVFCASMGGTVSIEDTDDGQIGLCNFADGTTIEEWAYYRAEAPKLGQWPSSLEAPKSACTVVSAGLLKEELKRPNESGLWLMPGGSVLRLMLRPVLPGENACLR